MITPKREFKEQEDIIAGCLKEDPRAQKALYDLFSSKMFSVCVRYMGCRELAKDVLQEGFITVFEKISSYSGSGSFEGWLRRVFVNTALMQLRKSNVLRFSEELNDSDNSIIVEAEGLNGLSTQELYKLISSMPSGFRAVFNLYVIEGFSHIEIANQLNITESASRSQLSRAKGWLKDRLFENR